MVHSNALDASAIKEMTSVLVLIGLYDFGKEATVVPDRFVLPDSGE